MSASNVVVIVMLTLVVLSCWLGAIGMWWMREPVEALHYLSLPAAAGMAALAVAVFLVEKNTQMSWKTILIWMLLLGINSVLAHATAQAFRKRELGHWEPMDGDPMDFVTRENDKAAL